MLDFTNDPHNRFNPLSGEWVKVSPHRTKRPWQGKVDAPDRRVQPSHDPNCYLCPSNPRIGGEPNPDYKEPWAFNNDFSALLPDSSGESWSEGELFQAKGNRGICRVMCFSPRHDLTLARMEQTDIVKVVKAWRTEYENLGALPDINHVTIFENRGDVMGCSNPHPHCQIWAEDIIPDLPAKELERQAAWYREKESIMLLEYARQELAKKERVVCANDHYVALVPFWAVWPFEILVLPTAPVKSLSDLSEAQITAFAEIMQKVTIRYDNLFQCSFPYSMGIHQLPTDGGKHPGAQFHVHFFPPLLRSASVRKFMVGYEMLAMPQRDLTAEQAAARLRDLSEVHYLKDVQ